MRRAVLAFEAFDWSPRHSYRMRSARSKFSSIDGLSRPRSRAMRSSASCVLRLSLAASVLIDRRSETLLPHWRRTFHLELIRTRKRLRRRYDHALSHRLAGVRRPMIALPVLGSVCAYDSTACPGFFGLAVHRNATSAWIAARRPTGAILLRSERCPFKRTGDSRVQLLLG